MKDVPLVPDAFVGRERELEAIEAAWHQGARIVALVGMGGSGKTRLALEHATRASERAIWFADLSSGTTEQDLAAAMGAGNAHAAPVASVDDVGPTLHASGPTLAVLDGFEHMAPSAVDRLRRWVREAPDCRFLVTTRLPLDVRGEYRILLDPLSLAESRTLLVDRIRALDFRFDPAPHEKALTAIAHRLEGIPLAIELAAARLQTLSPAQLLTRLDDRLSILESHRRDAPARHAALHATLDDAWLQLPDEDRRALSECTVFPGSFRIEAAEEVVSGDRGSPPLDRVERLVACGLLRVVSPTGGERRLRMLDVVREHVMRQDVTAARRAAEARHTRHYLTQVRDLITPEGYAQRTQVWVDETLRVEVPNLEAIVDRASADLDQRLDAGLAIMYLLKATGPAVRLMRSLSILRALVDDMNPLQQARLQFALKLASKFEGVRVPREAELVTAYRGIEHTHEDWAALLANATAWLLDDHGRITEAFEWYSQAIDHAERSGQPMLHAMSLAQPADSIVVTRPVEEAAKTADQMVALAQEVGRTHLLSTWLNMRSVLFFERGRLDQALADIAECHRLTTARGRPLRISSVLNNAEYLYAVGRADAAWAAIDQARQLQRRSGMRLLPLAELGRTEAWLALAEGLLDRAEAALSDPERHERIQPSSLRKSVAFTGRGVVALFRGHDEAALEHLDHATHFEGEQHQSRTDLCIVLMLRALAHARLDHPSAAREDRGLAQREARRWNSVRMDAVVELLQRAVDVCLGVEGAAEAARVTLRAARDGTIPRYAEVRFAVRLVEAELVDSDEGAVLHVGHALAWVQVGGQPRLDLERKPVRRGLVGALVRARLDDPGSIVSTSRLLEAGWPGDRSTAKALENRLWVTLSKLRRAGFEPILERTPGGYRIPEHVAVWQEPAPSASRG